MPREPLPASGLPSGSCLWFCVVRLSLYEEITGTIYLEPNQPGSTLALIKRPEAARSGMQADFFNVKAIRAPEDAP
ncbi:MAG: hypothetical protein Q8M07_32185 [Prosthecobacter sp.]|nr:hypothetical protein [Prosthecobacter sp.]